MLVVVFWHRWLDAFLRYQGYLQCHTVSLTVKLCELVYSHLTMSAGLVDPVVPALDIIVCPDRALIRLPVLVHCLAVISSWSWQLVCRVTAGVQVSIVT